MPGIKGIGKGPYFPEMRMTPVESKIALFTDKDVTLEVPVSTERDTVWLTANQMSLLFDKDEKTIRKHINNVFADDESSLENNTQKMRVVGVKQPVAIMIAESRTEEKESMISVVMNCLCRERSAV